MGLKADSDTGAEPPQAVALDGKVLRGPYGRDLGADGQPLDRPAQQQLSALGLDAGTVVGQLGFSGQKDDAEGAALRDLARDLAGTDSCVIADALHPQRCTAQHLPRTRLPAHRQRPARSACGGARFLPLGPSAAAHDRGQRARAHRDAQHPRLGRTGSGAVLHYISFPGVRFVAQVRRKVEYKKDCCD